VKLVPPPASGPEGVRRVGAGAADFAVTGGYYYLAAGPSPGARCVIMLAERSPLAAIVRADSALFEPGDLAGRRVGVAKLGWLYDEYVAATKLLGVDPPVRTEVSHDAPHRAHADREIEASSAWVDAVPVVRNRADVDIRAIPIGPDVYTTGIIAADRVPDQTVSRMTAAIAAAVDELGRDPKAGVDLLTTDYPDIHPGDAVECWQLFEPFAGPREMSSERWDRTLAHATFTHGGLAARDAATVYRTSA